MWAVLVVASLVQVVLLSATPQSEWVYTNEFAVDIDGDDDIADLVAGVHGCKIKRELTQLGNIYVFKHPEVAHRHKRSADDILELLKKDPNVKYVEQQRLLKREKRGALPSRRSRLRTQEDADSELLELARRVIIHDKQLELPIRHYRDPSVYQRFNHDNDKVHTRAFSEKQNQCGAKFLDPLYPDQWYLDNHGQSGGPVGYDVNVVCVWKKGITGKGVVVSILDDGLDHTHPDLERNYEPRASTNLNDPKGKSRDPKPNLKDPSNTHGTRCAGEVAAQANNSVCGIGIAFNCKIGGVKMLDGPVTDALEAEALNFNNQFVQIYSASWGPTDNGKTMEGPGRLCKQALQKGVTQGRGGLGSIFVWATGNGGMYNDTCSCDGYVSSIYTLSVGCISDEGLSTYFTEICPSTMAVIFTGGSHKMPGEFEDRNPKIKVVTTDPIDGCTLEFQGTSSAAPLAAGCFALVMEANRSLTWRDMQHIVVQTARIPNGREKGWIVNGANWHFNPRFGFGALDCGMMVEVAQRWRTVPEQHVCEVEPDETEALITPEKPLTKTLSTSGCRGVKDNDVKHLEHVEVHLKVEAPYRGNINIFLISPSGTRSEILRPRSLDDNDSGINFTFMTVLNWGEDPKGMWTLEVNQLAPISSTVSSDPAKLIRWGMTLYGTEEEPTVITRARSSLQQRQPSMVKKATSMDESELERMITSEALVSGNLKIRNGPEKKDSPTESVQDNDTEMNLLLSALAKLLDEQ